MHLFQLEFICVKFLSKFIPKSLKLSKNLKPRLKARLQNSSFAGGPIIHRLVFLAFIAKPDKSLNLLRVSYINCNDSTDGLKYLL